MAEKKALGGKFVPYKEMTDEQKREFHRLGGIVCQQKNKERRQLQQYLKALLDSKTKTGDVAGDMCWALVEKALAGDTKAFEIIRSTIGEDAPQKLEVENKEIKITLEDDTTEAE